MNVKKLNFINISRDIEKILKESKAIHKINQDNYFKSKIVLEDNFKKKMKEKGFLEIASGSNRIVFGMKKFPEIVAKVVLICRNSNINELEFYKKVKKIKNKYYRNKFMRVYYHSDDFEIIICEKLHSILWSKKPFDDIDKYIENIFKKIGLRLTDIRKGNIMSRAVNSKKLSQLVFCDFGE